MIMYRIALYLAYEKLISFDMRIASHSSIHTGNRECSHSRRNAKRDATKTAQKQIKINEFVHRRQFEVHRRIKHTHNR